MQSGANVIVTVGSASNVITLTDIQISEIEIADDFIIYGDNVYISGDAGNDSIFADYDAINVTIEGGKDNDSIYTNGAGNVILYKAGDGKDVIFGFGGDDTVEVNGNIGTGKQRESDVIFYINNSPSNSITFKNANVYDFIIDYNDDTAKWEIGFDSSSADILDDDNFMTFEAQIADVSEITADNYSVVDFKDYEAFAQDDNYIAYASEKNK